MNVEMVKPIVTTYKKKRYGIEDRNTFNVNKLPDFVKKDLLAKGLLREVKQNVKKDKKEVKNGTNT